MHILRCMGSKFCVKFQRAPLKFHTKFWTHTPQNMHFTVLYFWVWVTISLTSQALVRRTHGDSYMSVNCIIICTGNGFSPVWRQAIIWTILDLPSISKTPVRIILWCPTTKMFIKPCFLNQPVEQEDRCQNCLISLCIKVFINHFYQMKASRA